jgi:PAS domain S-box-containing protein
MLSEKPGKTWSKMSGRKIKMQKHRILLVDDEPVTAMAEAARLEQYGFEVKVINSGKAAIKYMKNNDSIDLIIMDIELNEDIDGIEVAKLIQKNHDIPILFLTAHEDPDLLKRTQKVLNYNYLLKDTSGQMLANAIHQALQLHAAKQKIKKQNKQLQQKEEQYRKIVQSSRDAMAIIKNDKIHFLNRAFIDLSALPKNKLAGRPINKIPLFDKISSQLKRLRNNCNATESEFEFKIKIDSDLRYLKARIIKIKLQLQSAFFLTLYDQTDQKEMLKKVERANRMADELGNFIPICAGCKKIKDEDNQDKVWIEPEIYISERLPGVEFTHGICPECAQQLYPKSARESAKVSNSKS